MLTVFKIRVLLSFIIFTGISLIVSCSATHKNNQVKQKINSTHQIEAKATDEPSNIPLEIQQTKKDPPKLEEVDIKNPCTTKNSQEKVTLMINRVNAVTQESSSSLMIDSIGEAKYSAFFLNNPLRFIIDFEKTSIMADDPSISKDDIFIKRIQFYNALPEDYARIEIYLKKIPDFNLERVGSTLKLDFVISEVENKELSTIRTALDKREKEVELLQAKVTSLENDRKRLLNKTNKIEIATKTHEEKLKIIYSKWISAWEKKDIDTFISFYSKRFRGRGMDLDQYRAYKKRSFEKYSAIKITAESLKITIKNNRGTVEFIQKFTGDLYNDTGIKKVYFKWEADNWKIVKETWNPV